MGNGDDNILFLDQVFNPYFIVEIGDFSSSCIAKLILYFNQFCFDQIVAFQFIRKQVLEISDQFHDFLILFFDLVDLHAGQAL